MWRASLLLGLVVLTACQSQPTSAVATPSASASASTTPSAGASASPMPSASASTSPLPPVSAGLACRLAISDGAPGSGGFITFPGGRFASDASSNVGVPGPAAGGRKSFGLTYDRGYKKWLPVPYDWVTPDGTKYVYPMGTSLAVVSVATGAVIQVLTKEQWAYWWPLDVENNGVWAVQVYNSSIQIPEPGDFDLWLWPFNGSGIRAPNTMTSANFQYAVSGSVGYDYEGRWVTPGSASTAALGRSNYSTGVASFIFGKAYGQAPGYVWVGVAADTVFLLLQNGQTISLAGSQPTPQPVDLGGDVPQTGAAAHAVLADSHGIWITGKTGLYLMTPAAVFRASDRSGVLAGGCR